MTIHQEHPFLDPSRDLVRALRGRIGGVVSLWTAGPMTDRVGLTVSSFMVAGGEPGRIIALLDPDSDLRDAIQQTGRAVVQLLQWGDRDLAEAFAGATPAPGGPFTLADWTETTHGPRLTRATTWAYVDSESAVSTGWSDLVTMTITDLNVEDDEREPLVHRRGRYLKP